MPAPAAAALLACVLTAAGSSFQGRLVLPIGLPITLAGCAVACLAAVRARRGGSRRPLAAVYPWLAAMAAVGLTSTPLDEPPRWYHVWHYGWPVASIALVAMVARANDRNARRGMWAAVAGATAFQLATVIAIPSPVIDVWTLTQGAVRALLHGVHPYIARVEDVYHGTFAGGYVSSVYPYMPATLVAHVPSVLIFGDYRIGLALCLPATVALVRGAGRRLCLDPRALDLVTLALVLHPRAAFVVGSGYNEPLLMLAAAAFVFAAVRTPDGIAASIAFWMMPAMKQYVVAPALIRLLSSLDDPRARRATLVGLLTAVATVVPFLAWGWTPTLDGIFFQVRPSIGFRADSLSLSAALAQATGWIVPWWMPLVAQCVAGALAYVWLRRCGLGGFLLASALALLASFLLGRQAFLNYYAFASMLLLLAALVFLRCNDQSSSNARNMN